MSLFVLIEKFNSSFNTALLPLFTALSILCGIFVIINNNPVLSVLFLIGLFIQVSFYLMTIGFSFIGLSYLLVYVGAVSILFLFILMLINIRVSELATNNRNSFVLSILITLFVSSNLLFPKAIDMPMIKNETFSLESLKSKLNIEIFMDKIDNEGKGGKDFAEELFFVTSSSWDGKLAEMSHISTIGNIIYTNYPIWLILTSIILLLAMVGSILITIKQ